MSGIDGGYFLHWVLLLSLFTSPVTVPMVALVLIGARKPARVEAVLARAADYVTPLAGGARERFETFRDRKVAPADDFDWEEA